MSPKKKRWLPMVHPIYRTVRSKFASLLSFCVDAVSSNFVSRHHAVMDKAVLVGVIKSGVSYQFEKYGEP